MTRFRSLTDDLCCIVAKEIKILFNLVIYVDIFTVALHFTGVCSVLIRQLCFFKKYVFLCCNLVK